MVSHRVVLSSHLILNSMVQYQIPHYEVCFPSATGNMTRLGEGSSPLKYNLQPALKLDSFSKKIRKEYGFIRYFMILGGAYFRKGELLKKYPWQHSSTYSACVQLPAERAAVHGRLLAHSM